MMIAPSRMVALSEIRRLAVQFGLELARLPEPIRAALDAEEAPADAPSAPFEIYMRATPSQRQEANRRVLMMHRLKQRLDNGALLMVAYGETAAEFGVSKWTIERAWKTVRWSSHTDWLALLVKDYKGRKPNDIAPEILATFFADYGRGEQRQLQAVYERTVRRAVCEGWGKVPSARTLKRRWDALPKAIRVAMREAANIHD